MILNERKYVSEQLSREDLKQNVKKIEQKCCEVEKEEEEEKKEQERMDGILFVQKGWWSDRVEAEKKRIENELLSHINIKLEEKSEDENEKDVCCE
jgi:hypothetical protein